MEIHEILTSASEAVEKASLPDEFKVVAFEKSIDILAAMNNNSFTPSDSKQVQFPINKQSEIDSSKPVIINIARKIDIEPEVLEEIYYEDEDDLKVIIGTSKLDNSIAGATKDIALLYAGGRQLGKIEDWTSTELIRDMCEYFGKYDSTNFAKTILSMDDVFSFIGSGQKRKVKIIRPGVERLTKLIKQITAQNGK